LRTDTDEVNICPREKHSHWECLIARIAKSINSQAVFDILPPTYAKRVTATLARLALDLLWIDIPSFYLIIFDFFSRFKLQSRLSTDRKHGVKATRTFAIIFSLIVYGLMASLVFVASERQFPENNYIEV